MFNMTKHKKISIPYNKVTITFGYTLFALTVLSFLISTAIPFAFSFQYPGARHFNIIVMVVTFAIATILPALASYFIGDKATHSKNKSLHHYNGVLFGVAAYWVAQLFSWVGFSSVLGVSESPYPTPLVVTNVIPVILTIILMAAVAVAYAKKRKSNTSVLLYRPFQIVLIIAFIGAFLYPYINGTFNPSFAAISFGLFGVPVVLVAISYRILAKYHTTRLARLSDAIIAMSTGWIATWLAGSFISYVQLPYQITTIPAYVVGAVVFVGYLFLRVRKS